MEKRQEEQEQREQQDEWQEGQQDERQVIFLGEFQMGGHTVLADADDGHVHGPEPVISRRKGACLSGTARSVVPGIKIENDFPAAKIRQADGIAVFIGKGKIRCFCVYFQHVFISLQYLRNNLT